MRFRPSSRQLEYLVAIAELRHFGRAAARCAVSQPTLSVQLQQLENRLGTALVDRSSGSVAMTPAGERAAVLARQALAVLDEMAAVAGGSESSLGGRIRLGVAPTFGPYFMPFLLPRLHRAHPELELFIIEERPKGIETAILEGETDCGIGPDPQPDARFLFTPLLEEELMLGVPAEHPLAARRPIAIDDLRGEMMMTLGRGHRLNEAISTLAAEAGAALRTDYEGTSLDALRQMVSIGMGLSLFPALYATSEFGKETGVVLRRLAGRHITRRIGVFWRKGSVRQPHFERFAAICAQVADGLLLSDAAP